MCGRVRSRPGHAGPAAILVVILAGCTGALPTTPSTTSSPVAPSSSATSPSAGGPPSAASSGVTIITRAGSLRDAALALIHERRPSVCVKEIHADSDPAAVAAELENVVGAGPFADGRGWAGSMTEAVAGLGGTEVLVSQRADAAVWLVGSSAVHPGSLVAIELKPYRLKSGVTAWLATGNAEAGDLCMS
jgi:hypothetical protein